MSPTRRFGVVALALAGALLLAMPAAAVAGQPQRATLDVEGMVCSGCEDTVESVLRGVGGVSDAEADRTTETVSVTYDGAATPPSRLVAAINDNTYYRASLAASPPGAAPPPAPPEAGGGGLGPALALVALAGAGALVLAASRVRRRRSARRSHMTACPQPVLPAAPKLRAGQDSRCFIATSFGPAVAA